MQGTRLVHLLREAKELQRVGERAYLQPKGAPERRYVRRVESKELISLLDLTFKAKGHVQCRCYSERQLDRSRGAVSRCRRLELALRAFKSPKRPYKERNFKGFLKDFERILTDF